MIATAYLSSVVLGLASFNVVTGLTIRNSEVIPGPGLPSLKELGITSAELYKIGRPDSSSVKESSADDSVKSSSIEARYEPHCGPEERFYTNVDEVIACYHYLMILDDKKCPASPDPDAVEFCKTGTTVVFGQSRVPSGSSSYCRHVADAVLWVIDHCTRGDDLVAGIQAATGNGDLLVAPAKKIPVQVRLCFLGLQNNITNVVNGLQAATGNSVLIVGSVKRNTE